MNGLLSVLGKFWARRFGRTLRLRLVALSAQAQSAILFRWQLLADSYEAMLGDYIERRDLVGEQSAVGKSTVLIDSLYLVSIIYALILLVCSFFDTKPPTSASSPYRNPDDLVSVDADVLPVCAGEADSDLIASGIQDVG